MWTTDGHCGLRRVRILVGWRRKRLYSVQGVQRSCCGLQLWYCADVWEDKGTSWPCQQSKGQRLFRSPSSLWCVQHRPGNHRSESPCIVGKLTLNLFPLRCFSLRERLDSVGLMHIKDNSWISRKKDEWILLSIPKRTLWSGNFA